jgi:CheY-like chemotaxis protein
MSTTNNILIVEDELIIANSIAELLTDEEYEVMGIAKSAAEAFMLCRNGDAVPAVVLCDINIKGDIKGPELALQLKEEFDAEIIFLTAYSDSKTLQQAFAADPVMYLVKPYNSCWWPYKWLFTNSLNGKLHVTIPGLILPKGKKKLHGLLPKVLHQNKWPVNFLSVLKR